MSIIKKDDPYGLTPDEVALAKSGNIPPEVRQFVARQHANIGTRTSMFRKIAAAAQAETEALLSIRDRNAALGEMANLEEARLRIEALERKAHALEVRGVAKDAEIRRLTAGPAEAVHSGD